MGDGNEDTKIEGEEISKLVFKASHEAKLKELLHNVNSIEFKLYSDATKEFIKLLRGESGAELLHLYVQSSSKLIELLEAWKLQQGKPGMSYILSLISAILSHPDGKYKLNDRNNIGVSRVIDKFTRLLVEEKLEDIYKELNSKEGKRQNAALSLLASMVRRGAGLAYEIAKKFDFKIQGFSKLAEYKRKNADNKRKHSTRKAFVGFAMSFLEVGKPGLLRWVLQQKEMYSGVLRMLNNDDEETIILVLTVLRDRILTRESLIPPGLRSVLFGSVTLEQLIGISAREDCGPAAELAYNVLVVVCTDPCNGLMPDLKRRPNPLRGNPRRLLGLMKKLKATEIAYHRDLLLAIFKGRPSLGSAYMSEFPYNLEDYTSPTWFPTVSLAASLISSMGMCTPFDLLASQSYDVASSGTANVQNIMSCICPRSLSRTVINKGLLHSDVLVKHGTLRLLLEALKLLDSLITMLNCHFDSDSQMMHNWGSLKQEIQNEARSLLPDFQVLLTLLSSLSGRNRSQKLSLKRKMNLEKDCEHSSKVTKKSKKDGMSENVDIIIGGMSSALLPGDDEQIVDALIMVESDTKKEFVNVVSEIWALDLCSFPISSPEDAEIYFQSKLLDALKIYLRTVHNVLEGSFDFFMNFLSNPLALSAGLQRSFLSLLNEYVGWSPGSGISIRPPPLMYKHLQPFINLLILSPASDIRDLAYNLARAAMLSTGAFDRDLNEVGAWFLFLPGYSRLLVEGVDAAQSLSSVVVSFLCDAVSTIGNNLFKYWDLVRHHVSRLKGFKGVSADFSPLIVCVLLKGTRLLSSESKSYTLPEKSIISLYVSNTLKYLLQTQVDAGLLSALIHSILSESCLVTDDFGDSVCEWRPLKSLLDFSQNVLHTKACCFFSSGREAKAADSSFASTLGEVKKIIRNDHIDEMAEIIKAFSSAMLCTTADEILKSFPQVITICRTLSGVPTSLLSSIVFLEQTLFTRLSKLWPEMFSSALEMAVLMIHHEGKEDGTCGVPGRSLSAEETVDIDGIHSVASAFCFFLKQMPFHVLFPAIISVDILWFLEPSKIKNLLLARISECATDCLLPYMRLVLFWFYQVRSSYIIEPLDGLRQLSEICLVLLKHLLSQLLVLKPDSEYSRTAPTSLSAENIQVASIIFHHPIVIASLSHPFSCDKEFTEGKIEVSLKTLLTLCKQNVHEIDHHVLDLLTATCENFLSHCQRSIPKFEGGKKPFIKAFGSLVQMLLLEFRNKFDLCVGTECLMPLLPAFYAVHALIQFISPFRLLELVHWMLNRVCGNESSVESSFKISLLSIGFCIVGDAFEILSIYLHQPVSKRAAYELFWEIAGNNFDSDLIEGIYVEVCNFATNFELDFADVCLLKVVNAVYGWKNVQQHNLHQLSLVMSRAIQKTPVEIVSHFIYRTTIVRAKFLFLLSEMSTLHLSIFGHLFLSFLKQGSINQGSAKKGSLVKCSIKEDTRRDALKDAEFMMLLPTALSYLNSVRVKFEKNLKHFVEITSFYSRTILNGFLNWRAFVSCYIFEEEYDELFTLSTEELLHCADSSLLMKAVRMLQYHFAWSGDSMKMKRRIKLFNSIFPCSDATDDMLDCDVDEMEFFSINKLLNVFNMLVAKVAFSKMLLFPEDSQVCSLPDEADKNLEKISLGTGSAIEDSLRMRFMNILVGTWKCMVKKFTSVSDGPMEGKSADHLRLHKYFQDFILRSILDFTTKMHSHLIHLESVPFLEELMRCSLIYRFEDPATLKILGNILSLLSDGNFSRDLYLQLLLAHSQFASSLHSLRKSFGSYTGTFLRPMSSILTSFAIGHPNSSAGEGKSDLATSKIYATLEIVKLLKILLKRRGTQCSFDSGKDTGIELKELHSLLLSSYGATLNRMDLEIYRLMHEIEFIDEPSAANIAEMDYLWGSAALRVRKERALEKDRSSAVVDTESVEECQRIQFRENFQVDPKICATTVLWFPYNRIVTDEPLSSSKLQLDDLKDVHEMDSPDLGKIKRYDPVFILRFSVHSLSAGYIEPVEFAGLGLLAVAFVGMSSPDVGMRKLSYETLGRFSNSLEKCSKNKDATRLQLLLTYLQNGIEEPWQRIPSVIALFAAEASLILMDPSHDHYPTLTKVLMHSSRVNLKVIPLFRNFFWSTSVNFKKEKLWILRLAYAGLNIDDDAQIYIRNSIIETLLSFYSSSLADIESKELILQIVKKSVKLHKMAHYLVEHSGLLSWLSSVLSLVSGTLLFGENQFSLTQLVLVTEVVNDVLSFRNIVEWLQRYALEQLMEISSHLYGLLVGGWMLIKENVALVHSILQILLTTLKISQKRKIYQPHFTLSLEGVVKIYRAVTAHDPSRSIVNAELGLKVLLMSTPPSDILHMDKEMLSSFLTWGTSVAMISDSRQMSLQREFSLNFKRVLEEVPSDESLVLKFLRWLVAAVILGELSFKGVELSPCFSRKSNVDNLHGLLEYVQRECQVSRRRSDSRELLASQIFYVQQLLGMNSGVLSSSVSALSLLLSCDASIFAGDKPAMVSLLLRIQCPPEVNPSWRWSFYQPWKDLSSELSDLQKIDELHACQTLLLFFANMLGKKSLDSRFLLHKTLESCGVFKWEKSLIESE